MGLIRTALIFGAGYVIGHPAGRAKVAELAQRPEVAQLREKAAATASTGVEAGKKQIAKVTDRTTSTPADGIESGAQPAHRAGRRLPSFPRRGARPSAAVSTPAASPTVPDVPVANSTPPPSRNPSV